MCHLEYHASSSPPSMKFPPSLVCWVNLRVYAFHEIFFSLIRFVNSDKMGCGVSREPQGEQQTSLHNNPRVGSNDRAPPFVDEPLENYHSGDTSLTVCDFTDLSGTPSNIGNHFLSGCSSLISVQFDASKFAKVTRIGDHCFADCRSLTSLEFQCMPNAVDIGDHFAEDNSSLAIVNFEGMSNVSAIGSSFLAGCESLTSVNFSGFANIAVLSDWLLHGCSRLTNVDLSGLSNVKTIGSFFLNDLTSLKSISFSGMTQVNVIRYNFLASCPNLCSIDFTGMDNLERVECEGFLLGCNALTSVKMPVDCASSAAIKGALPLDESIVRLCE